MHSTANLTIGALMTLGAALTASSAVSTSPPGTSDPISLTDVDGISISGIGRATVAIGSPAELTISGPPQAVDQPTVAVEDEELTIEPESEAGIEPAIGAELRYEITVERLVDIRLHGDVSLELDGLSGTELRAELADTATAVIADVQQAELRAEVRGSAVLRVTGTADELEVDARDSGAFDGIDLAAGTAEVDARDTARVVVNAATLLEGDVRGSAIVEHVGAPAKTELDVRDAGEVRAATGTLIPAAPVAGSVPATSADVGTAAAPDTIVSTEPASFEVSLAGRAFNPGVLEISVGDTVTWINDDDTEHTVTAFEGAFDSGDLAEGASFSFTFDTPGEYRYRCLFHSEMQATIVVR